MPQDPLMSKNTQKKKKDKWEEKIFLRSHTETLSQTYRSSHLRWHVVVHVVGKGHMD